MTPGSVTEGIAFARRARISTNEGVPIGICLTLTQSELQNFGIDLDACDSVHYYPQEVRVDGSMVRVLRLVEPADFNGTIGD